MKTKIIIASAILAAGVATTFTACAPDYDTDFDKNLLEVPHKSQALITFQKEGGERTIEVKTNVPTKEWQAKSNAEWCKIEQQDGKVVVKASTYDKYQMRKAVITINYGHQSYDVKVIQLGLEATLQLVEDGGFIKRKNGFMAYVEGNTDEFVAPVSTNLNIDHVIVPDTTTWVHFDKPEKFEEDAQGRKLIKLKLDANKTNSDRYCTMTLQSSQNWDATVTFVLIQSKTGFRVVPCYTDTEYTIEDLGGKIRIPYTQEIKDGKWFIKVPEAAKEWLTVKKDTLFNTDGEFTAIAKMNLAAQPREAVITMKSENQNKVHNIKIKQQAFKEVPPFNVINAKTHAENGKIKLTWDQPEIVNYNRLEITMHNEKLNKTIKKEVKNANSTSIVFDKTFKFAGEYEFTIKSFGPTGKETNQPVKVTGTSKEWSESVQIKLTEAMISANATHDGDGGGIPALIDNNTNTYYHSAWNDAKAPKDHKPHRLQFNLESSPCSSEFYFDYMGRGNGDGGGDVKKADIYGSTSGVDNDDAWEKIGEITYELPAGRGQQGKAKNHLKPNKTYTYLRFIPTSRRNKETFSGKGTSGDWFNMSEIRLYQVHDEAWAEKNINKILK